MRFIERIQKKSEGQRRFLMLVSMLAFSFLVLVIAWKSFERNLGARLGGMPAQQQAGTLAEETQQLPGFLQPIIDDIRRIAGGEEPLARELRMTNHESRGAVDAVFSFARETRRVVRYNAGEIQKWLWEVLRKILRA